MVGSRTKKPPEEESVAHVAQSTPDAVRLAQPGHDFVLQAVIEMQRSVGNLDSKLDGVKSSVDGVKSKVDDLVAWKHKILGGAAVLAIVIAVLG